MKIPIRRTAAFVLITCLSLPVALSQISTDGLWQDIPEPFTSQIASRQIVPVQYRTISLDVNSLTSALLLAPMEGTVLVNTSPFIISLPLPEGGYGRFRVVESPIMAPELQARYPQVRTYLGQGVDDPAATVRFDITPHGFHAMILSAGPTIYIDPYSRETSRHYISYFKRDLLLDESRVFDEIDVLGTDSDVAREIAQIVASGRVTAIGEQLRTYRLALATTGEYTIFHGGTVELGLAAVVTAMNRVNGIYEREVAVRMVLVTNNDQIIYTNPSTDPYTNNSGSTMLGQNQSNLDAVIGSANYDIGHVFSTGGGGIAGLGVVCRTSFKARGVTGLPSPIGDPFYVDYVAHEMGHQYGANHTFNGNAGSCSGGNRNASTAYEPGSGTTVMAYAGICGSQNTQGFSDDYFHGISIDEIVAYTTIGQGSGCPVVTSTGNDPPTVSPGPGGNNIPIGTPFALSGNANDPNSDTLTFTWEEFDLGPAGHPNTPSDNAPIFRSFKGTTNPTRTFPRMFDILNNVQTIGEILPSYTRTMNFRLTARDNRAGGGGVGKATISITAWGTAGPFMITHPNTSVFWISNSVDTVRWAVANTNVGPVNCTHVHILLSRDGGQTFQDTLAANTPNDGEEVVAIPNIIVDNARVKVIAANNIFFDISNVNFSIATLPTPILASPANNATNQPLSPTLVWNLVTGATSYHLQVSTNSTFTTTIFDDSTLADTSRSLSGLANGTQYFWRVRARNNDGQSTWSATWNFRTVPVPPNPPTLSQPPNNSVNQPTTLTLRWNVVLGSTAYWVQVSLDSLFTTMVVEDSAVAVVQKQITVGPATRYFWRVRGKNAGGFGSPSTVWNFTTASIPAQVSLVSPSNGAFIDTNSVLFSWMHTGTPDETYWFELGEDSAFIVSAVDSLQDTSHTVAGLGNRTYWWRVRAGTPAGWGPFSETRSFFITLTGVDDIAATPTQFSLSQNYPNPFNPSTVIRYALPVAGHTTLTVFNAVGQEMALLVNDHKQPGRYEVQWDAGNIPSGVYFYRLQVGNFVQVKKLVLMK
jgi:hypothetical protein